MTLPPGGSETVAGWLKERLDLGTVDPDYRALAQAYLRLSDRFSKVLAISDKYQELLKALEPSARAPGRRASDDPPVAAPQAADPLAAELTDHQDPRVRELAAKHAKLLKRMDRIVSISDAYQAELRDTTMRLEALARTDALTGLANRRAMVDHLEIEAARAERLGGVYSVILFDIDDFKLVNDRFGHDAGDLALAQVAGTLRGLLRRTDLCSRWGGEEFLVLCPQTDLDDARQVAQKCLEGVGALVLETRLGSLKVTLSGGVAVSRAGEPWGPLVNRADDALYRAKARGKNLVLPGVLD